MPGHVHISVHNEDVVAFALTAVGERAASMRPVWPRVLDYLRERTELNIETEGASVGRRWEKLSYEWLSYKFRNGLSLETMKATDELFESLTQETSDSTVEFYDDRMVYGSDLPQFAYQMEESDSPFRPPVDLTAKDGQVVEEFISGWILGEFNRIGQRTTPGTGTYASGPGAFS